MHEIQSLGCGQLTLCTENGLCFNQTPLSPLYGFFERNHSPALFHRAFSSERFVSAATTEGRGKRRHERAKTPIF